MGMPIRVYDPQDDCSIVERRLPHWSQAYTMCFITWRTWDSMPAEVVARWQKERADDLRNNGIAPTKDWRQSLYQRGDDFAERLLTRFSDRWHEHLDNCHGRCVLARPELARIVEEGLLHFDRDRYELTDFVIMPNHVHLLVSFPDRSAMLAQCESWKQHSARQLNRELKRSGRFWQQDAFDHLVRSSDQFAYLRKYIADNSTKARLPPGRFIHYSRPM